MPLRTLLFFVVVAMGCLMSGLFAQEKTLSKKEIEQLYKEGKIDKNEARRLHEKWVKQVCEEQRKKVEEHQARVRAEWKKRTANSLVLAGPGTGSTFVKLYEAFRKEHPTAPPRLFFSHGGGSGSNLLRPLTDGMVEAMLIHAPLNEPTKKKLAETYPKPVPQPKVKEMGRFALVIVVNKANTLPHLSLEQLENIYRRKTLTWKQVGGDGEEIFPCGKRGDIIFYTIVLRSRGVRFALPHRPEGYTRKELVAFRKKQAEAHKDTGGDPYMKFKTDGEVLDEVAKKKNAIGFCTYPADKPLPETVRIIPITTEKNPKGVSPTPQTILEGTYPLYRTMQWFISPKASTSCTNFIDFICSKKAIPQLHAINVLSISEKPVKK